jgi:Fe2+ or Zn2+ uptake regulation protein
MKNILLEQVIQRLQTQGGRMTAQRHMILEALDCLGCHPTAEQIFDMVSQRDPSLSLSTVYRTLRWLEQEGFISGRRFEDAGRTERFDPAGPVEHYHFVCSVCKIVIEFDEPLLDAVAVKFAQRSGARVDSLSMTLYGLCPGCRGKGEPDDAMS